MAMSLQTGPAGARSGHRSQPRESIFPFLRASRASMYWTYIPTETVWSKAHLSDALNRIVWLYLNRTVQSLGIALLKSEALPSLDLKHWDTL